MLSVFIMGMRCVKYFVDSFTRSPKEESTEWYTQEVETALAASRQYADPPSDSAVERTAHTIVIFFYDGREKPMGVCSLMEACREKGLAIRRYPEDHWWFPQWLVAARMREYFQVDARRWASQGKRIILVGHDRGAHLVYTAVNEQCLLGMPRMFVTLGARVPFFGQIHLDHPLLLEYKSLRRVIMDCFMHLNPPAFPWSY